MLNFSTQSLECTSMVIILIILFLSKVDKCPLTFLIKFSILNSINFKASFMAVSDPPYNSSNALVTSSVHTI